MKKFRKLILGTILALALVSTGTGSFAGMDAGSIVVEAAKKKQPAISKKKLSLYIKKTATLKVKNAKGKIKWSSSNKKIAKVTSKGKVTAVKKGKTTIKAKVGKKTYKCTVTVNNPTLSPSTAEVYSGKTVTLKVTGAVGKIAWSSSNTGIATVSSDGVVTGVKPGKAEITALASGVKLKSTINVKSVPSTTAPSTTAPSTTVPSTTAPSTTSPATTVSVTGISLDKTNANLDTGNTLQLTAAVAPANAGNKAVTWTSSDTKVATVDANGLVKAVGEGTATITVTTKDSGKTASCKITVTTKTESQSVVANETDLKNALEDSDIQMVHLSTTDAINLTIPSGDYSRKSLVINAPNGHIENYAKFKNIKITAISNSTFVENASGNTISYEAEDGSIKITDGASASIDVVGDAGTLNLINDGTVSSLVVASADTNVNISGDSAQLNLPVSVTSEATSTSISTSSDLAIEASTSINLTVENGGQNTTVTVDNQESMPESVTGLGQIEIKVQDTNTVETVVADSAEVIYEEKYAISGIVKSSSSEPLADAKVSIIPYSSEITSENIADAAAGDGIVSTATAEDGSYETEEVSIGNYYIYITKEDYAPVISTLILISESDGNAKNFTMVTDSDENGNIFGELVDAQTGGAAEEGLTVYLRQGSNNTSGSAIASTTTDAEGCFTFAEIAAGQYTIKVVDQRESAEGYYVSAAFDLVVSGGSDTSFRNSVTKIIASDQIRFVLTWGTEDSGASADLDSHLIGPAADGSGQFHVYSTNRTYANQEDDVNVTYASLDVDDTYYEGPETTTIYVSTKGTYSFYVHDASNSDSASSDQMSHSSAVVKAYIGTKLMATYSCPNKTGNLWYVCDYNATSNKFTAKNVVSGFEGNRSVIGSDLLEYYQERLSKAIETLETTKEKHTALEIPETMDLDQAKTLLAESEDYIELKELSAEIYRYLNEIEEGFGLSVEMYEEGSEGNLVTERTMTHYDDIDFCTLTIKGVTESLCKDLRITATDEGSTAEIKDSDREDYEKMVVVKNKYGMDYTFYVIYEKNIPLDVGVVDAGQDEDHNNIIISSAQNYHADDENNENSYYSLDIIGRTFSLPENIVIYTQYSGIKVEIVDSDKAEYEKMAVLSYGEVSRNYYINYTQYLSLEIDKAEAGQDENGNDIITRFEVLSDEDSEGNGYKHIELVGNQSSLPEKLKIIPKNTKVKVEIVDSDWEDYEKMAVLSYEDSSPKYYINYRQNIDFGISKVEASQTENGENIISTWGCRQAYDKDWNVIYFLDIEGSLATLPDYVKVTVDYSGATAEITASDKDEYEKMVVVTYGDYSRNYYIEYVCISDDSEVDEEANSSNDTLSNSGTDDSNTTVIEEENTEEEESTEESDAEAEGEVKEEESDIESEKLIIEE